MAVVDVYWVDDGDKILLPHVPPHHRRGLPSHLCMAIGVLAAPPSVWCPHEAPFLESLVDTPSEKCPVRSVLDQANDIAYPKMGARNRHLPPPQNDEGYIS